MNSEDILGGVAVVGIGAFMLLSGGGENAQNLMQGSASIKQMRTEMIQGNEISRTKQEMLGQREQIALQRFQNGCIPHLKRADIQRPEDVAVGAITVFEVPVREGDTPLNWSGAPYPSGSVVCGREGGTVLVDHDGRFTDYAFTGSDISQLWQQNMQRYH
jgi:hypothetical protein